MGKEDLAKVGEEKDKESTMEGTVTQRKENGRHALRCSAIGAPNGCSRSIVSYVGVFISYRTICGDSSSWKPLDGTSLTGAISPFLCHFLHAHLHVNFFRGELELCRQWTRIQAFPHCYAWS